mgnify:CR=1 FL=1
MESIDVPPDDRLGTRIELVTRWSDEDNQSVLNNAVYLTLLEEARLYYFRSLKLMEPEGAFPFVLAQCNVKFAAPGRGGERVEVRLATMHIGNTSFEQAYRVRSLGDGVVWCEARARLVAWDKVRRAKQPIDPRLRAAVEALERRG